MARGMLQENHSVSEAVEHLQAPVEQSLEVRCRFPAGRHCLQGERMLMEMAYESTPIFNESVKDKE